ncbi:type II secretion system protein N [Chitinibacteraceae bacterium HSL-7]
MAVFASLNTFRKLLEWALLAGLLWMLAGLFWQFFVPRSADLRLEAPPILAAHSAGWQVAPTWFGAPSRQSAAPSTVRLVAVIAGGERYSVALLAVADGSVLAYKPGDEVEPGMTVETVAARHVTLLRNGVRMDVRLPEQESSGAMLNTSPTAVTGAASSLSDAAGGMAAIPAQSVTVTRSVLAGAMQGLNLAEWSKGLAPVAGGGIRVTDVSAQAFARMLQLQNDDELLRVNGRQLTDVNDMSTLYSLFSQVNEVKIDLRRSGAPLQLNYRIEP